MRKPENLADRLWLAWHALPRGKRGKPPTKAEVERSVDPPISNGTLNKIFSEEKLSVELETAKRLAHAFHVSVDYVSGEEAALVPSSLPTPTGPVPDRRAEYGIVDTLADMAAKADALGGAAALVAPRNMFEAAVQTLVDELSPEAIAKVADEARGAENSKPAHHWGARLRSVESELRALGRGKPAPKQKRKKGPKPKAPTSTARARKAS